MIVASAGRRIDAPNADPQRFPQRCIPVVRERIRAELQAAGARRLVCSAACGADLIALDVAGELGVGRRIIVPAPLAEFRAHSVVDRPGDWGPLFDRLVAETAAAGDLEELGLPASGAQAYLEVNAAILGRATALARETRDTVQAFAIWDGPLAGRTDYTGDFVDAARRRGLTVRRIGILD